MVKVLLCGYFGFGNLGDEALLQAVSDSLAVSAPGCIRKALSHDPDHTWKTAGIRCFARSPFTSVIRSIKWADTVLFCGGSVFQDKTSFGSMLYYSAICFLSKLFGRQYILSFQGLGPIKRKASAKLLKAVLKGALHISLRDRESLGYALSIHKREYFLAGDPVLLLQGTEGYTDRGESCKKVVFILKDIEGRDIAAEMSDVAEALKNRAGAEICHAVLFPAQDSGCSERFAEKAGSSQIIYKDAPELIERLREADLAISVRYHGLILSLRAETPCIPLSYDPKVDSLAAELNMGNNAREIYKDSFRYLEDRKKFEAVIASAALIKGRAADEMERLPLLLSGRKAVP